MNAFATVTVVVVTIALAIFMTVTEPHHGSSVDLPKVNYPISMQRADREDSLLVVVTKNGDVFFGTEKLTSDQLPGKIREGLRQGAERKVYIKADGRAKYGKVAEVLDGVRAARITNIAFLVDQRKSPLMPE